MNRRFMKNSLTICLVVWIYDLLYGHISHTQYFYDYIPTGSTMRERNEYIN